MDLTDGRALMMMNLQPIERKHYPTLIGRTDTIAQSSAYGCLDSATSGRPTKRSIGAFTLPQKLDFLFL